MRMTASWFGSLDLPHTRLWRDSTAPESGLPSDCHPDCIIVLETVSMRPGEIQPRNRRWTKCVTLLDSKRSIQGPMCRFRREARARERRRHVVVDSLKALDPNRPIREVDSCTAAKHCLYSITSSARASSGGGTSRPSALAVVRLMTRLNLVDCKTGRSAGLAPFRT
jgi:hypothetical protein